MNKNCFTNSLRFCLLFCVSVVNAGEFDFDLKAQTRLDKRTDKDNRVQYRVRTYGQYTFDNEAWSINTFAVTGQEFASSHNTVDDGSADYVYFRRLYARYEGEDGTKTELGIIPTYKGRVSSSGLAKDGWIKGIRQVYGYDSDTKFELVVGELDNTRAKSAFNLPKKINYVELELSSSLTQYSSYELSIERMTNRNYVRAEYRIELPNNPIYSFEVIRTWDDSDYKTVVGVEDSINLFNRDFDYYGYYTYVSSTFGPRAELTEDFISTGNGISVEVETKLLKDIPLNVFARFDGYNRNTRFILGLGYSF